MKKNYKYLFELNWNKYQDIGFLQLFWKTPNSNIEIIPFQYITYK